jgi:aspartate/glutamate racemase
MRSPTIGILGGAGAIASARFHLDLVQAWAKRHDAKTDDDFPRLIHTSRALALGATGVVDYTETVIALAGAIGPLKRCDRIAVVCNSVADLLPWAMDGMKERLLTPVAACRAALQGVTRARLLASESTIRDQIYQRAYPDIEWSVSPATHWIEDSIRGLPFNLGTVGHHPDETIVLGCTELSTQVRTRRANGIDVVSPTDEMIRILCNTTR